MATSTKPDSKSEKNEKAEKFVSLETLNSGAAIELWNRELDAVLQNIADPNTKATAPREVILKVKLVPAESRKHADVSIQVSSKFAPTQESKTVFFLGNKRGHTVAAERDIDQMSFLDEEAPKPVALPDRSGK
jgi:hypothetical protein